MRIIDPSDPMLHVSRIRIKNSALCDIKTNIHYVNDDGTVGDKVQSLSGNISSGSSKTYKFEDHPVKENTKLVAHAFAVASMPEEYSYGYYYVTYKGGSDYEAKYKVTGTVNSLNGIELT